MPYDKLAPLGICTLDLMGYFHFLFSCARDPNFTTENVIAAIDKHIDVGIVDGLFYRLAIPEVRAALVERGPKFDAITAYRPACASIPSILTKSSYSISI